MSTTITPAVVSVLQNGFVEKINAVIPALLHIASSLLLLFATLEFVVFGILFAMNRQSGFSTFLFKVLKIGFIIALVNFFPQFINLLIKGFLYFGDKADPHIKEILSNPTQIWSYGFDTGINLLKISVHYGISNLSAANLYLILGFGTLFMFGLIIAQIVCITLAYYFIAMVTLVTIPFSVFQPMQTMLSQSLQQLFKAGIRILTLMVILSLGNLAWANVGSFDISSDLTGPLGFFFSTLVMLVLCLKLPNYAAAAVGQFKMDLFTQNTANSVSPVITTQPAVHATTAAPASEVAHAAQVHATNIRGDASSASNTSVQAGVNVHTQQNTQSGTTTGSTLSAQAGKSALNSATKLETSLSRDSMRVLKRALQEVFTNDAKNKK